MDIRGRVKAVANTGRERVGDSLACWARDITYLVDAQQRVMLHLLLILIRNLLVDQDARDEARQLETLVCSVMYGERRYTIDIAERAPLPDALMNGKTHEVKPADPRPSGTCRTGTAT
jgi:hypothetical protein